MYDDIHENILHWLHVIACRIERKRKCKPVFYDIGAHRGVFACSLAERCSQIVCFEPEERSHKELCAAVSLYQHITVLQVALWKENKTSHFYRYSDASFDGLGERTRKECEHYGLDVVDTVPITLYRLDDIMEKHHLHHPDIIKMDVEGAELMVLHGATALLSHRQPYILLEYSYENTKNLNYTREALAEELHAWGYRLYGLHRSHDLTLHRDIHPRSIWNLIAIPSHPPDA